MKPKIPLYFKSRIFSRPHWISSLWRSFAIWRTTINNWSQWRISTNISPYHVLYSLAASTYRTTWTSCYTILATRGGGSASLRPLANEVENIDSGQVWACPSITLPKSAHSNGDLGLHQLKYMVPWASKQSTHKRHLDRFPGVLQDLQSWPANTETDHATAVTIGRIECCTYSGVGQKGDS